MANVIKIKSSTNATVVQTSLEKGEMAYSYGAIAGGSSPADDKLYIGGVDGTGTSTGVVAVGGQYYMDKLQDIID